MKITTFMSINTTPTPTAAGAIHTSRGSCFSQASLPTLQADTAGCVPTIPSPISDPRSTIPAPKAEVVAIK